MKHLFLTETQRWTILNALQTAAHAYQIEQHRPCNEPLAKQFERQVDDALVLYDLIEQASDIELVSDGLRRVS